MTETTTPPEDPSVATKLSRWRPLAKDGAMILSIIISAIATYSGAAGKADKSKDLAEAGQQETIVAVEKLQASIKALDDRVTALDGNLSDLRKRVQRQQSAARRKAEAMAALLAPRPMPPPPPVVVAPIEMSPNLDKALEKIEAKK